jgi:hypothetical protein
MNQLLKILCAIALGLTILPPLCYLGDKIDLASVKKFMLAGTILWFCAAGWLMQRTRQ